MARDMRFEHWLGAEGVQFDYHAAWPLANIDIAASLQNQARLNEKEVLNKDRVEDMARAMERSVIGFPPVIGYQKRPNTPAILNDGNHRVAGAGKAGLAAVELYLLRTTDPFIITRVTHQANMIEGVCLSREERMAHAVYAVRTAGSSVKAAADAFQLAAHEVGRVVRLAELEDMLGQRGVDPKRLPKDVLLRLGSLSQNSTVFAAATLLTIETGFVVAEVNDLLRDLRVERTEDGQLGVIERYREREDVQQRIVETRRGRGRSSKPRKSNFLRSLKSAQNLLQRFPTREALQLTADVDLRVSREVIADIVARFGQLAGDGSVPVEHRPPVAVARKVKHGRVA